jgi:hypothetical protein
MVIGWLIDFTIGQQHQFYTNLAIGNLMGWAFGIVGVLSFYENPRLKEFNKRYERLCQIVVDCYDKKELKRLYNEDFKKLKKDFSFHTPRLNELETIIVYKYDAMVTGGYTIDDMVKAYDIGYNDFAHGYDKYMDRNPKKYIQEIFNQTSEEEK